MSEHGGEQRATETVTVYADYVCPFCYLGRQSLEQYQAEREQPLEVDWQPFDLRAGKRTQDGELPEDPDDGKDDAYFERAKENVRRLQAEYDVEMTQELRRDVDSLPAQLASYHVAETCPYEDWRAFDDAIYAALWQDGRDIGDEAVLVDLAEDAGIDPEDVRAALSDDDLRSDLEGAFQAAREAGISGVPTFVYGDRAARGAAPPEQLRQLVEGE